MNNQLAKSSSRPERLESSLEPLLPSIYETREILERMEESELADKASVIYKTLLAHYFRRDFPLLVAITGPQGTGKSRLANELAELPEESRLPERPGRGEKVPIILTWSVDERKKPVRKIAMPKTGGVEKTTEKILWWEEEYLEYGEAREKAANGEGVLYIWSAPKKKKSLSKDISFLVLPGVEEGSEWGEFAKQALLAADASIFVIDLTSYAQAPGHNLMEYIRKMKLPNPLVAVSFAKDSKDKDLSERIKEDLKVERVVPIDLPEIGKEEMKRHILELASMGRSFPLLARTLKGYLRNDVRKLLKEADELIKEERISKEKKFLVEEAMDTFKEDSINIEKELLLQLENTLDKHLKSVKKTAIDDSLKEILGEQAHQKFWTWLTGVSDDQVQGAQNVLENSWENKLNEKIKEVVNTTSESLKGYEIQRLKDAGDDKWMQNAMVPLFKPFLLINLFAKDPDKEIEKLHKMLEQGGNLSGDIMKQVEKRIKETKSLASVVSKKAKSSTLSRSPSLAGGAAAGGGTLLALPGGILIAEASVVAVAAIAAFSIVGIRNYKKDKIEMRMMMEEALHYYRDQTYDNFKKLLRHYLEVWEYEFKKALEEQIGANDQFRNMRELAIEIKASRDKINDAIGSLEQWT